MNEFTDLLDEYLDAKKGYDEARDAWMGGGDFRYCNFYVCGRYDEARDALNAHMARPADTEGEDK